MIVNRTLVLGLFVCLAYSGFPQTKKSDSKSKHLQPKTNAIQEQNEHSLLWKVTSPSLPAPSYIFGTMHILCADDAQLSDSLKEIIKNTGRIFFEIDLDNAMEMMTSMKYLRMNDGKKISDLLSPADYQKVKDYFDKNNLPIPFSMMNRFKPYFVSSLVGERLMECGETDGMEQQIMKEATKYDKDILGLETIEFQAGLFDSIPYEKQAKDLVTYIDSIDEYKKTTQEMVDVYLKQDLQKMEELIEKSDPAMTQYMDLLLYDRNKKWIDPMQSSMVEMSTLFAVGAGHLAGPKGILALLRKKGYTVTPVKN